ncbi:MAG: DUF4340 domain-containing protein [Candidatus Margulisbacteria bacterium]|nr:DUF4340 domain-containing protein [Candidatus Margulisiibacteriota bacterium]
MNRLILCVCVIVVSLGGYGIFNTVIQKGEDTGFSFLTQDQIDTIKIGGDSLITISKTSTSNWMIGVFPSDTEMLNQFLKRLRRITGRSLVTQKREKHPLFKLEKEAIPIEILSRKKTVFSILVGKQGPIMRSSYIRFKDDNRVYLIDEPISESVSFPVTKWQDLKLLNVRQDHIYQLIISRSGSQIHLTKKKGKWVFDSGKEVNRDSIYAYLYTISRLKGVAMYKNNRSLFEQVIGTSPSIKMVLILQEGAHFEVLIGKKVAAGYYAYSPQNPQFIYIISHQLMDYFKKHEAHFSNV